MKIGELEEGTYDSQAFYEGWIRTLDLDLPIQLRTNDDKQSNNSPDFFVLTKTRSGQWVQIGNAWKKLPKNRAISADEFLSITIDDPSFEKAINVAAFCSSGNSWFITWRRRQDRLDPDTA